MVRADGHTTSGTATTTLRAVQVLSALSVVVLAVQFVTAGELFPNGGPEEVHATGAIVLHVVTGLTAIACALLWRGAGAPAWPAVLATVVFALTFVQAYYGGRSTLWIHIPGAMVLTVGAVWVLVWSVSRPARPAAVRASASAGRAPRTRRSR